MKYYERYWKAKPSDELPDFSYKWPAIKPLIPQKKGVRLLDYGCGSGFLLSHIKKLSPKLEYIGADVSNEGLKRARKRLSNVKLIKLTENGKISLGNKSVDYITCLDVIEHVYEVENLLKEFRRILAPGGKLLISTPYHGLIKNIVIALVGFETVYDPFGPHIRFFTNKSLQQSLEKTGFKVVKRGYFGRFYPLSRGFYMFAS